MFFILPVRKLVVTDILKFNDVVLIPHFYFYTGDMDEFDNYEKKLETLGMKKISKALDEAWHYHRKEFFKTNVAIAVCEYPFTIEQFNNNGALDDFIVLDKIASHIDATLDYIRLRYSNYNEGNTMPDFPGILDGFKRGVAVDIENQLSRSVLGEVCETYSSEGIGILLEDAYEDIIEDPLFDILFSNRKDEVYLNCRSALRRINQSFYFNNLEVQFIYLMSTIEMLASLHYEKPKEVRAKIIPFIANNKKDYHEFSSKFRYFSEELRTRVAHCGESLVDVVSDSNLIKKYINNLITSIIKYCEEVIETKIDNFEGLEKEREERKKRLGLE